MWQSPQVFFETTKQTIYHEQTSKPVCVRGCGLRKPYCRFYRSLFSRFNENGTEATANPIANSNGAFESFLVVTPPARSQSGKSARIRGLQHRNLKLAGLIKPIGCLFRHLFLRSIDYRIRKHDGHQLFMVNLEISDYNITNNLKAHKFKPTYSLRRCICVPRTMGALHIAITFPAELMACGCASMLSASSTPRSYILTVVLSHLPIPAQLLPTSTCA